MFLTVLVSSAGAVAAAPAKEGAPSKGLLGDKKNWKLTPAKDWRLENGVLAMHNEKLTAAAQLLRDDFRKWPGYVVTVKVRCITPDPNRGGGFNGVVAKGVRFLVRTDGYWALYRPPGAKRSVGTLKKATVSEDRWSEIRIVTKGDAIRGFIDGEPWYGVAKVPAPNEGVSLISCHLTGEFKDFEITPITARDEAELAELGSGVNLLGNSSFEQVIGDLIPEWRAAGNLHLSPSPDEYFDSCRVVEQGAFDGARCVRLTTKDPKYPAGIRRIEFARVPDTFATFSVYMKADKDGVPVELSLLVEKKTVSVGREWKRFSVSSYKARKRVRVSVTMKGAGTVWVDAAQVEAGKQPTPYAPGPKYSEAEWLGKKKVKPIDEVKVIKVPMASTPIKPDGVLDEAAWEKAASLSLKLLKTFGEPKEGTTARILCDRDSLYFAFTCKVAPERVIPADEATRMKGPWATDCVEVILDPTGKRKGAIQMASNLAGSKGGSRGRMGKANWSDWVGEWKAAGSRKGDRYTVEFAVPFAVLELGENAPRRWPFNLARGNPALDEYSATTLVKTLSFHELEQFDLLELPAQVDLKRFAVRVAEDRLVEGASKGACSYAGKFFNATGRDGRFKIEVSARGLPKPLTRTLEVAAGSSVDFVLGQIPLPEGARTLEVQVRIYDSNGALLRISDRKPAAKRVLSVFPALSFFSNEGRVTVYAERAFVPRGSGVVKGEAALTRLGKVVARARSAGSGKRLKFDFPRAGLDDGTYTAVVKTTGALEASGKAEVVVRAHLPGETKIDHLRRCMVIDGKPTVVFLPLATTYHNLTDNWFKLYADNGMPNVTVAVGRAHGGLMGALLDRAAKFGVRILYFRKVNADVVKHPSLLGWLVVDEPSGEARVKEVIDTVEQSRRLDPHHVIYCNHFPHTMLAGYAGLPGDVISIDYYPIPVPGRSIIRIGDFVRKMEAFARPRRIPTWFYVQGSGIHAREPTAAEYEAQAYIVLVNGGTGLQWFFGMPGTRREWKRFVSLAAEVRRLNDVLLSLEPRPAFTQQFPGEVNATSRRFSGDVFLIAVNGTRDPVDEVFTVPGAPGKAEVLFENRTVPITDGRLADRFEPLQRHVYRIAR